MAGVNSIKHKRVTTIGAGDEYKIKAYCGTIILNERTNRPITAIFMFTYINQQLIAPDTVKMTNILGTSDRVNIGYNNSDGCVHIENKSSADIKNLDIVIITHADVEWDL